MVKNSKSRGRQSECGSFKTEINLHGVQLEAAAYVCFASISTWSYANHFVKVYQK